MQSNMLVHLLFLSIFSCLDIYAHSVDETTHSRISPLKDQKTTESTVPNDLNKNGIKDIQINIKSSIQKSTTLKGTTKKSTPVFKEKSIPISREQPIPISTEQSTPICTESTTEGSTNSQRNPDRIGPRLSAALLKVLTK